MGEWGNGNGGTTAGRQRGADPMEERMKTEPSIHPDMTISALVETFPKTQPVLARHRIDLCCGGGKTLAFAALAHGIDLQVLLRELTQAREDGG